MTGTRKYTLSDPNQGNIENTERRPKILSYHKKEQLFRTCRWGMELFQQSTEPFHVDSAWQRRLFPYIGRTYNINRIK